MKKLSVSAFAILAIVFALVSAFSPVAKKNLDPTYLVFKVPSNSVDPASTAVNTTSFPSILTSGTNIASIASGTTLSQYYNGDQEQVFCDETDDVTCIAKIQRESGQSDILLELFPGVAE